MKESEMCVGICVQLSFKIHSFKRFGLRKVDVNITSCLACISGYVFCGT